MERDRDLKARTNTFLSCEICGKNCWQVSGDRFMLTRTEFCSNLIATQEFCFVSAMAGDQYFVHHNSDVECIGPQIFV